MIDRVLQFRRYQLTCRSEIYISESPIEAQANSVLSSALQIWIKIFLQSTWEEEQEGQHLLCAFAPLLSISLSLSVFSYIFISLYLFLLFPFPPFLSFPFSPSPILPDWIKDKNATRIYSASREERETHRDRERERREAIL